MWYMDLVAPSRVESSQTKDQICFPCIGMQILIHCTTREVLFFFCSLIFGEVEYLWEEGAELQYFPLQDLCGTQEAGYRKSQYEMEFK